MPLKVVGDGPLLGEMRSHREREGLPVRVPGHAAAPEVLDLIGRAELQVIASECFEGFPARAGGELRARNAGRRLAHRQPRRARRARSRPASISSRPTPGPWPRVRRLWSDADLRARIRVAARREYEDRYTPEQQSGADARDLRARTTDGRADRGGGQVVGRPGHRDARRLRRAVLLPRRLGRRAAAARRHDAPRRVGLRRRGRSAAATSTRRRKARRSRTRARAACASGASRGCSAATSTGCKLLRQLWFYACALPLLLFRRRPDLFVTQTNPPLVVPMAALAAWLHGRPFMIVAQDIYPEVMIANGMVEPGSRTARLLSRLFAWAYRRARTVVSLGPVMTQRLRAKASRPRGSSRSRTGQPARTRGARTGQPAARGLGSRGLLRAALFREPRYRARRRDPDPRDGQALRERFPDLRLLFVGKGSRLEQAKALAASSVSEDAVQFRGFVPLELLPHSLGLADAALVTLLPGSRGWSCRASCSATWRAACQRCTSVRTATSGVLSRRRAAAPASPAVPSMRSSPSSSAGWRSRRRCGGRRGARPVLRGASRQGEGARGLPCSRLARDAAGRAGLRRDRTGARHGRRRIRRSLRGRPPARGCAAGRGGDARSARRPRAATRTRVATWRTSTNGPSCSTGWTEWCISPHART